jgi:hypothetical protein
LTLSWPKPNRALGFVDALGLTGLVGLLTARFIPLAKIPFWGCALRQHTGWPCPGCGLTRAAERVAHGNLGRAWEANPLGTIAALGFVLAIGVSFAHLAFKVPVPSVQLSRREAFILRATTAVLVAVNYGFIIVKTKFPGLL